MAPKKNPPPKGRATTGAQGKTSATPKSPRQEHTQEERTTRVCSESIKGWMSQIRLAENASLFGNNHACRELLTKVLLEMKEAING